MPPLRGKLASILAGAGLYALTLVAWTQPWFLIQLQSGAELSVAGDVAAPALSALALAGLALIAALSIAGPFFRVVLGALGVAIGALIVVSAVLAIIDPISASVAVITDATGVSGDDSLRALVASAPESAWPWLTVVIGSLSIFVAVAVLVNGRSWPGSARKYQAVRLEPADGEHVAGQASEHSAVDDWDALSDGSDPTSR